jgi:hypothetical protein
MPQSYDPRYDLGKNLKAFQDIGNCEVERLLASDLSILETPKSSHVKSMVLTVP